MDYESWNAWIAQHNDWSEFAKIEVTFESLIEAKRFFQEIDKGKKGRVSALDVQLYNKANKMDVPLDRVRKIVDEIDSDHDGFVSFWDFFALQLFKNHASQFKFQYKGFIKFITQTNVSDLSSSSDIAPGEPPPLPAQNLSNFVSELPKPSRMTFRSGSRSPQPMASNRSPTPVKMSSVRSLSQVSGSSLRSSSLKWDEVRRVSNVNREDFASVRVSKLEADFRKSITHQEQLMRSRITADYTRGARTLPGELERAVAEHSDFGHALLHTSELEAERIVRWGKNAIEKYRDSLMNYELEMATHFLVVASEAALRQMMQSMHRVGESEILARRDLEIHALHDFEQYTKLFARQTEVAKVAQRSRSVPVPAPEEAYIRPQPMKVTVVRIENYPKRSFRDVDVFVTLQFEGCAEALRTKHARLEGAGAAFGQVLPFTHVPERKLRVTAYSYRITHSDALGTGETEVLATGGAVTVQLRDEKGDYNGQVVLQFDKSHGGSVPRASLAVNVSNVILTVIQVSGLHNNFLGKVDPYVLLNFEGSERTWKTKVIRNSGPTAQFDERFDLPNNPDSRARLFFYVYDSDLGEDDLIGVASVEDICGLAFGKHFHLPMVKRGKPVGKLTIQREEPPPPSPSPSPIAPSREVTPIAPPEEPFAVPLRIARASGLVTSRATAMIRLKLEGSQGVWETSPTICSSGTVVFQNDCFMVNGKGERQLSVEACAGGEVIGVGSVQSVMDFPKEAVVALEKGKILVGSVVLQRLPTTPHEVRVRLCVHSVDGVPPAALARMTAPAVALRFACGTDEWATKRGAMSGSSLNLGETLEVVCPSGGVPRLAIAVRDAARGPGLACGVVDDVRTLGPDRLTVQLFANGSPSGSVCIQRMPTAVGARKSVRIAKVQGLPQHSSVLSIALQFTGHPELRRGRAASGVGEGQVVVFDEYIELECPTQQGLVPLDVLLFDESDGLKAAAVPLAKGRVPDVRSLSNGQAVEVPLSGPTGFAAGRLYLEWGVKSPTDPCVVSVSVRFGENLSGVGTVAAVDPYIEVRVESNRNKGPQDQRKHCTSIALDGGTQIWNENLQFELENMDCTMVFELRNKTMVYAVGKLPLKSVTMFQRKSVTLPMMPTSIPPTGGTSSILHPKLVIEIFAVLSKRGTQELLQEVAMDELQMRGAIQDDESSARFAIEKDRVKDRALHPALTMTNSPKSPTPLRKEIQSERPKSATIREVGEARSVQKQSPQQTQAPLPAELCIRFKKANPDKLPLSFNTTFAAFAAAVVGCQSRDITITSITRGSVLVHFKVAGPAAAHAATTLRGAHSSGSLGECARRHFGAITRAGMEGEKMNIHEAGLIITTLIRGFLARRRVKALRVRKATRASYVRPQSAPPKAALATVPFPVPKCLDPAPANVVKEVPYMPFSVTGQTHQSASGGRPDISLDDFERVLRNESAEIIQRAYRSRLARAELAKRKKQKSELMKTRERELKRNSFAQNIDAAPFRKATVRDNLRSLLLQRHSLAKNMYFGETGSELKAACDFVLKEMIPLSLSVYLRRDLPRTPLPKNGRLLSNVAALFHGLSMHRGHRKSLQSTLGTRHLVEEIFRLRVASRRATGRDGTQGHEPSEAVLLERDLAATWQNVKSLGELWEFEDRTRVMWAECKGREEIIDAAVRVLPFTTLFLKTPPPDMDDEPVPRGTLSSRRRHARAAATAALLQDDPNLVGLDAGEVFTKLQSLKHELALARTRLDHGEWDLKLQMRNAANVALAEAESKLEISHLLHDKQVEQIRAGYEPEKLFTTVMEKKTDPSKSTTKSTGKNASLVQAFARARRCVILVKEKREHRVKAFQQHKYRSVLEEVELHGLERALHLQEQRAAEHSRLIHRAPPPNNPPTMTAQLNNLVERREEPDERLDGGLSLVVSLNATLLKEAALYTTREVPESIPEEHDDNGFELEQGEILREERMGRMAVESEFKQKNDGLRAHFSLLVEATREKSDKKNSPFVSEWMDLITVARLEENVRLMLEVLLLTLVRDRREILNAEQLSRQKLTENHRKERTLIAPIDQLWHAEHWKESKLGKQQYRIQQSDSVESGSSGSVRPSSAPVRRTERRSSDIEEITTVSPLPMSRDLPHVKARPSYDGGALPERVVTMVAENNKLSTLDLTNTSLGDSGIAPLLTALLRNTTITSLSLQRTEVSDPSSLALAAALSSRSCAITDLNLSYNDFSEIGIGPLLSVIGVANQSLRTLNLSGSLRDPNTHQLIAALRPSESLTALHLDSNNIADIGTEALCELISDNPNGALECITLCSNMIDDVCVRTILRAVKSNSTLSTLDLTHNPVSDTFLQELRYLMNMNADAHSLKAKAAHKSDLNYVATLANASKLSFPTLNTTEHRRRILRRPHSANIEGRTTGNLDGGSPLSFITSTLPKAARAERAVREEPKRVFADSVVVASPFDPASENTQNDKHSNGSNSMWQVSPAVYRASSIRTMRKQIYAHHMTTE